MATTTGNVKISQLAPITSLHGGEIVPISYSVANNNQYESYRMSVDQVRSYMDSALGLSGATGMRETLNAYVGEVDRMKRDLGQYKNEDTLALSTASTGKYISVDTKTEKPGTGLAISAPVELKEGTIYLLKVGSIETLPSDISIFTKRVDRKYHVISGTHTEIHIVDGQEVEVIVEDWTEKIDTVYEPLSSHYHSVQSGGYGAPTSGYVVFFACEDETIVVSAPSQSFGTGLIGVRYGIFSEIAEEFLGIDSDLMKVLVEAIAKNNADIARVAASVHDFGSAHGVSLDLDNYLSVKGEPMIRIEDHKPSAANAYHGAEVPNRIGQMWFDTTAEKLYIATKIGTGIECWREVQLVAGA